MHKRYLLVTGLAMTCGGTATHASGIAGEAVFKSQCSICHSAQPGRNEVGPSLFGVVGRHTGQVAGFHYSTANKSSGLTWDTPTLDRYLTSPQTVIPHTLMTYGGLRDTEKRAALIAYLSTLH
jgi:cytochrome c2